MALIELSHATKAYWTDRSKRRARIVDVYKRQSTRSLTREEGLPPCISTMAQSLSAREHVAG